MRIRNVLLSLLTLLPTTFAQAANQNLRVGVGSGCTHATLSAAFSAIVGESGSHTIRINKGTYAVPEGMLYNPTVAQTAVFLEGGYDSCLAPIPSGVATSDADRAIFDGTGGSKRSVLDLSIYGLIDTFQIRRIALQGGDATTVGNPSLESGGGLIIRGQASVLLGAGTSIRNNSAINGGGVALSGSNVGSSSGYFGRVDLFITDGAEVRNNSATSRGGGLYCGGNNGAPDFTPAGLRHGSIVLVDGTLSFNRANEGAAFYCVGSLDGGGGFQPRPAVNKVAWIIGNQIVSTGAGVGCAAGFGTLDTVVAAEGDGFRHLGAAANSTGLTAITNNTGDRPALCLTGSRPRNAVNDPPPAGQSRFRLRNLLVFGQSGSGFLGLVTSENLSLIIEPSGDAVACTFFEPTPCVALTGNMRADAAAPDARLMFANSGSALQLRRAKIDANDARPELMLASGGANITLLSAIVDDNTVATSISLPATSALFAARSNGTVDVRSSTVITRSALTQFYRLGATSLADSTGSGFAQASAFAATVGAPLAAGLEGGAVASQFNRFWCGYFVNTTGFAGHTVVNDPATGAFSTAASFSTDASYSPTHADLRDACSAPPGTLNRDFYGRPFNVVFESSSTPADIGAVEAQLPDAVFRNGFELAKR